MQRDTEPLPQDITQLKTLITEHQVGGAKPDHILSGVFFYMQPDYKIESVKSVCIFNVCIMFVS